MARRKKTRKENKDKGIWKAFVISYLLPVIGGIIIYFQNEKKNLDLARINLVLSIFHPFLVGFFIESFLLWLLSLFIIPIGIFLLLRKNRYSFFTLVFYYGLIGFLIAHYKYKKKVLKENAALVFIAMLVINILFLSIVFRLG